MPLPNWPRSKQALYELGEKRVKDFCELNDLPVPPIMIAPKAKWDFGVCAFYRPDKYGIRICLEYCGRPCDEAESRNWTWPGSTTDREPYGVLAHELGHHVDYLVGGVKEGAYFSDYGRTIMEKSGETPISGYHDGPEEWFAEMFRVFVTNHGLLMQLRPKTYELLSQRFDSIGPTNWRHPLGGNVPARVLRTLRNKGAK